MRSQLLQHWQRLTRQMHAVSELQELVGEVLLLLLRNGVWCAQWTPFVRQ